MKKIFAVIFFIALTLAPAWAAQLAYLGLSFHRLGQ